MAKVLVNEESLTNIANAIREKNGETTVYKPSEMANAIINIQGKDAELEASFISSIDNSLGLRVTKLPSGLTSIRDYTFRGCSSLKLNELPSGITSIGESAFYECKKLELTKLPSNLTSIERYAFYNCEHLKLNELPSGITSIGDYTFQNCYDLKLTKIPEGVEEIGISAFYNCNSMPLAELPASLETIKNSAFRYCSGITSLTFKGATQMQSYAFDTARNLSTIIFPNITSVPYLAYANALSNTPIANGTGYIYVPDDLVDSFKSATNWSVYADQIKAISELEASA